MDMFGDEQDSFEQQQCLFRPTELMYCRNLVDLLTKELEQVQQRGNIWHLMVAQALAGANAVVIYATCSIVRNSLAPASWLATLPISIFVVGMAACILPIGR